jgi:TonB-linked SusC/RagA family outer membrane protein
MKQLLLTGLLLSIFLPFIADAQNKPVTGTVTDQEGGPVPGTTVLIKNTKTLVQTDAGGRYKIQASATDQLVFSYLGFTTQTITVGTKTTINVSLQPNSTQLSDVVVVGYGTAKRADLTGSVGSVNMAEFAKAPVKSFDEALAGRVSGVQVQSSDGQPGATANIIIRGSGSISQDNSPLYVIDGFPSENANANSISPSDIESIDILKDASATAIYGARGANGVVLITTKKGKAGEPKVSYNAYYGIQQTPKKMEMMGPYEFVRYVRELNQPYADSVYLKNGVTLDSYKSVQGFDMQDYAFQVGQNQNHDVAVRGGSENTQYAISGNFNNQKGIVKYGGFKRYQGRIVLDQKLGKKVKIGTNVNYAYSEQFGTPVSATNFYATSTLLYAVWGWRPVTGTSTGVQNYDPESSIYDPVNDYTNNQDYRVNPTVSLQNQITRFMTNSLVANGYLNYTITKNLNLRLTAGITNNKVERNIFNNSKTQAGSKYVPAGPNGTIGFDGLTNWLSDNTLTYSKTFAKDHKVTLLGGVSAQGNANSSRSFYANQLPNEDLGLDGLDLAPAANGTRTSSSSRWTLASALARLNYDYKSKYLLTVSFRADGSSKFPPNSKWGYFPSASAAWRISKENFMTNVKFISDAKLRVGYGETGNNRVGDFAYLKQIQLTDLNNWYSANNVPNLIGSVISDIGNEKLRWETSKQTNIGIDLSLFKDRITLTADVYKKVTSDLLLNAAIPYALGIPSGVGFKNVGSLQNKGLEIALNTINVDHKDFKWSSNFNISFNQNKILKLAENQTNILAGSGTFFHTTYSGLFPYISTLGNPLGQMYGLISDGVYQLSDFDLMPNNSYLLKPNVTASLTARNSIRPGDVKYKDLNGDLLINSNDYTIIGNGLPTFTGGFSNTFTYKNFDLSVLLQWTAGNDVVNANRYLFEGGIVVNPNLNQFASYANRWTFDNQNTDMFRVGGMGAAAYSSRVIEDGSYLKVRTVALGYNLPKELIKSIGLSGLRANVSAQNLFTISGYSGQDPEVSSRQSNLTPGFDYAGYPHSLTVVFGLNATF